MALQLREKSQLWRMVGQLNLDFVFIFILYVCMLLLETNKPKMKLFSMFGYNFCFYTHPMRAKQKKNKIDAQIRT